MARCKCVTSSKNRTLYTSGKCKGCETEKAFYEEKLPEIQEENDELQEEYDTYVEEIEDANDAMEEI